MDDQPTNFYMLGTMGLASSIGLGLALTQPKPVIVIDSDGNCSSGFTTKKMIHGWIEKGGEANCGF